MTAKEFYLDTPLYSTVDIESNDHLKSLIYSIKVPDFNGYNPIERIETTFSLEFVSDYESIFGQTRYISLALTCLRTKNKFQFFSFWDGSKKQLTKIGQRPSLADFHISLIKQYDKVLKKEQLREFTKAIGLAANGVGIGSFVYLRRIFETLVFEAAEEKHHQDNYEKEPFLKLRMAEKINFLKEYLPDFLVENKEIYSILSLGIHELKEDVCLANFEVVKLGIEMILEEKLEKFNKAKRSKEASDRIKLATQKLNTKSI